MKFKTSPFIELLEDIPNLNNLLSIKITRLIIRILILLQSFKRVSDSVAKIHNLFLYIFKNKKLSKKWYYIKYLLYLNKIYFLHLSYFQNIKLADAAYEKKS